MRDPGGLPFAGTDRERLFRAARRHSHAVRLFRRAIPVTLLAVLVVLTANAYFKPLRILAKLPIDPAHLVLSGPKIIMDKPRLGGVTRDGRPYDFTAREAAQDITNPGVLEMTDLTAHVALQDRGSIELRAQNGVYDTKADTMLLKTNIVLTTSTGYVVHLQEATVDNKAGRVVSDRPVEVTMSTGTINANGLEVVDSGDLIRFTNGVESHFTMAPAGPTAAPAAAPGARANPTTEPR